MPTETSEPIAGYALLSDCHGAALVSSGGSVDWLCLPRFDSPSSFGRILGGDAGSWSLRPAGEYVSTRRYLGPTMVLETVYTTGAGTVRITDALALGNGNRGHDLGSGAPGTLLRYAECTGGSVELEVFFSPRPGYGLLPPVFQSVPEGLVVRAGGETLVLSSPVSFGIEGATARGRVHLRAGQSAGFALQSLSGKDARPQFWAEAEVAAQLEDTAEGWESWSAMHQAYEGPWQDMVSASGRVLQALMYFPTGAIVAAPTTSLPEVPGGARNWDYRYTWIRDASMTLQALWVAACPDEAGKFFQFLATAAAGRLRDGGDLQIMYGVGGERELTEQILPHLPGWRESRPVRIGNGAWNQRQLDVYGELLDAAATLPDYLSALDAETREFLADAADAAADRWQLTDHGIWEVRGRPRHFLHSKLMCWVAVDRAIRLADLLNASDRVPAWETARTAISESIHTHGWNDALNAYTQAYGSRELDASVLLMSIAGFLPPTHPRMLATIQAVEQHLLDNRGLVYRYRSADGLAGEEGTFLLCTFWLAQALALAGETGRARDVFERAAGFATDLGLLSEEVAPDSNELLGNFPQAFSHIGLINAAWAIRNAECRAAADSSAEDGAA